MPASRPDFAAWSRTAHARYRSFRAQPSWVHQLLGIVVLLVLVGLAAVLLVFGLIVGAVVAGVAALGAGVAWIARRLSAGGGTGGGLAHRRDPRKNVRVVTPDRPPR